MYYIDDYEEYLKAEKSASEASCQAYLADIDDFEKFINAKGLVFEQVTADYALSYIEDLKNRKKSTATRNRRIASLKSFYDYLIIRNALQINPFSGIKAEQVEHKDIVYLTVQEISDLMEIPDESANGIRDRALLELMYATGVKVSELCCLNVKDVDLKIGYVSITAGGKARVIPIGRPCREALKKYLDEARSIVLGRKKDCGALILSYRGERITRQGVWKIIKNYAEKTGLGDKLSPQTIRNSFAAHLLQNGADIKSLQELLGHEDIMATKVYLSVCKNRIMDVYDKAFPRA